MNDKNKTKQKLFFLLTTLFCPQFEKENEIKFYDDGYDQCINVCMIQLNNGFISLGR